MPSKERLVLSEECLRRLAEGSRSRYEELAYDPQRLVEALREDRRLGLTLVECDTDAGLSRWFDPEPVPERDLPAGWWVDGEPLSGPLGETAFAAAWAFAGRHVRGYDGPDAEPIDSSPLSGVPATGRQVIVRGFTIISANVGDDGVERVMVRRYVDWAGVFGQLGFTLNWRVPLPG